MALLDQAGVDKGEDKKGQEPKVKEFPHATVTFETLATDKPEYKITITDQKDQGTQEIIFGGVTNEDAETILANVYFLVNVETSGNRIDKFVQIRALSLGEKTEGESKQLKAARWKLGAQMLDAIQFRHEAKPAAGLEVSIKPNHIGVYEFRYGIKGLEPEVITIGSSFRHAQEVGELVENLTAENVNKAQIFLEVRKLLGLQGKPAEVAEPSKQSVDGSNKPVTTGVVMATVTPPPRERVSHATPADHGPPVMAKVTFGYEEHEMP